MTSRRILSSILILMTISGYILLESRNVFFGIVEPLLLLLLWPWLAICVAGVLKSAKPMNLPRLLATCVMSLALTVSAFWASSTWASHNAEAALDSFLRAVRIGDIPERFQLSVNCDEAFLTAVGRPHQIVHRDLFFGTYDYVLETEDGNRYYMGMRRTELRGPWRIDCRVTE